MESIFPLPRAVRHGLIDKYCRPDAREAMKNNESNKDYLVRPYLGRGRFGSGGQFFSLRNFKLHADQVKELGLVVDEYIQPMAHALAVLHWKARIDGKDVEFVLGSSPMEERRVRAPVSLNQVLALRPHTSTHEQTTRSTPDSPELTSAMVLDDFALSAFRPQDEETGTACSASLFSY